MQPEALEQTRAALVAASNLFRLGMEGAANDALVKIIDGLAQLLADPRCPGAPAIDGVLAEVLSAQERGDVLRIADLLEFELLPRVAAV